MLSMPFAEDTAPGGAATPAAPPDEGDEDDEDARQSAYAFEGYEIDSSVRIMLTPLGLSADRRPTA